MGDLDRVNQTMKDTVDKVGMLHNIKLCPLF